MSNYHPRLVNRHIDPLHQDIPALMITGPRGTGKTSTAMRHAATVVSLDRLAEARVSEGRRRASQQQGRLLKS